MIHISNTSPASMASTIESAKNQIFSVRVLEIYYYMYRARRILPNKLLLCNIDLRATWIFNLTLIYEGSNYNERVKRLKGKRLKKQLILTPPEIDL